MHRPGIAGALRPGTVESVVAMLAELIRLAAHVLLAAPDPSAATITALAATVLVGALLACLVSAAWTGRLTAALPLSGRSTALRKKSWGAAFLRQRDPDAAGRPRPRAPGAAQAAA